MNTKFGLLCFSKQPDTNARQWATPKVVTTDSDGAANGSTIISSSLAAISDSDDDFVGNTIVGIDCENTQNNGFEARIVSYADATGTVTCDRFPAQTKSGDTFYMLSNPAGIWAEDAGGAADGFEDGDRDEADDYWLGAAEIGGPYLEVINATNISESSLYLITDFAQASGKADATLGANTAVGDYAEAWVHPEIMNNAMLDCTREPIAREVYQGTFDTPKSIAGNKDVSGEVELAFRGPGRSRDGLKAECDLFLNSVLDASGVEDLTVDAGSTTSSVAYDAGTAVDGQLYCTAEGDVFMCTSAATPLVPTPTLGTAPAEDSTIVSLRTYTLSDVINYHLAAKQYRGKEIIEYIFGLVPDFTIAGELGQWTKISMNMMGCDWFRIHEDESGDISRAWDAKRPTVPPLKAGDITVKLDGTSYGVKSFNVALGLERQKITNMSAPNESGGFALTGYKPTGQIVFELNSSNKALMDDFMANNERELLIQVGSRPGFPGVLAIYAKAFSVESYQMQDDGGKITATMQVKMNYHTTDDIPVIAIGIG